MENKNLHTNPNFADHDSSKELFSKMKINYDKSKDEAWNTISNRIENKATTNVIRLNTHWLRYAAAALLITFVGISTVIRYYSQTIVCPAGQHKSVELPDGSTVELNADSKLAYYPFWWIINRQVKLSGEAFFEVEKGSSFTVNSNNGKTIVLGTSFNVYTRGEKYEVVCKTGRVKVVAHESANTVILNPNEKASLNKNGMLQIDHNFDPQHATSWIDFDFFFTSTPLNVVFNEIERQYAITINAEVDSKLVYTGNFKKDKAVENILNLVCKPFGINFVKKSEGEYQILQNK